MTSKSFYQRWEARIARCCAENGAERATVAQARAYTETGQPCSRSVSWFSPRGPEQAPDARTKQALHHCEKTLRAMMPAQAVFCVTRTRRDAALLHYTVTMYAFDL